MTILYSSHETYDMLQQLLRSPFFLTPEENGYLNDLALHVDSAEEVRNLPEGIKLHIGEIYDQRLRW